MIPRYNYASFLFGVPGIILQVVGRVALSQTDSGTANLGRLGMIAGTILLLVGLAFYAKAKGRHPAWCLFAFLSIIGLIVLACLNDKT
jgi:hypothetical protein